MDDGSESSGGEGFGSGDFGGGLVGNSNDFGRGFSGPSSGGLSGGRDALSAAMKGWGIGSFLGGIPGGVFGAAIAGIGSLVGSNPGAVSGNVAAGNGMTGGAGAGALSSAASTQKNYFRNTNLYWNEGATSLYTARLQSDIWPASAFGVWELGGKPYMPFFDTSNGLILTPIEKSVQLQAAEAAAAASDATTSETNSTASTDTSIEQAGATARAIETQANKVRTGYEDMRVVDPMGLFSPTTKRPAAGGM